MSASEVIEQIKALPPHERMKVLEDSREMDASSDPTTRKIRYASEADFQAASENIFTEHAELFRGLAEYERQESSGRS